MKHIQKVIRFGTVDINNQNVNVFCKILYVNGVLSISGVEGLLANGNARGSCGQIDMDLRENQASITLAPKWNKGMLVQFFDVWENWHLNDMKAGSPAQELILKQNKFPGYPLSHYDWAKQVLTDNGVQPDESYIHNGKPYSYGSAWLREEVPDSVIAFLESLPETDITPAWV